MKDKNKAILFMVIAAFFYALIAANVKWIEGIPVFEKLFFRTFFGLIFTLILIRRNNISLKGVNKIGLYGRGITGFLGAFLYYIALSNAPMAETVTLSNLYPFLMVFFCAMFLGEKIKKFHIIALILSFCGAVFIIRPGFDEVNIYFLIALLSSVFMASTYTILKHVRKTDSSELIVLYFSVISAIGCFPLMLFEDLVIPSAFQLFQLISLGFFATIFQLFMTTAYKYAPASEVSIYSYTSIIFSGIFGVLFWNEVPHIFSILGIILILLGAYTIYKHRDPASDTPVIMQD